MAIIGSVFSSVYVSSLDRRRRVRVTPAARRRTPPRTRWAQRRWSPAARSGDANAYLAEVNDAFLSGLSVACFVAAAVAAAGSLFALRMLPARAA